MASLLQWQCHPFEAFCLDTLYEMLSLRDRVFVVEQQSIYGDLDGLDQCALHVCGRDSDGRLQAYARLIPPGHKYADAVAITRVVVEPGMRGRGIGQVLFREALQQCEHRFAGHAQKLSAQLTACGLYQAFGFTQVSDPYDDGGILHVDMLRTTTISA